MLSVRCSVKQKFAAKTKCSVGNGKQMSRQSSSRRVPSCRVIRVSTGRRLRQSNQDGCRGEHAITSCSSESMSERTVGQGTPRKRGHQHHPRNHGTRRKQANPTDYENKIVFSTTAAPETQVRILPAVIGAEDLNNCDIATVSASFSDKRVVEQRLDNSNKVNNNNNNKDDQNNITSNSNNNNNNSSSSSSNIDLLKVECDLEDSLLKKQAPASNRNEKPSKNYYKDIPRPAAEGSSQSDAENEDPEQEEWTRLRCTSERAEDVAKRETRRRNRRCADYPGLAFGSSIFSSDTMMKFSIIRNELYNIMNTQLKRVCNGIHGKLPKTLRSNPKTSLCLYRVIFLTK